VFNPSLLCPTELDAAWMKFKSLYLAKKKLITEDFMFAQGYPVVDESNRIFIDARQYLNQQTLGVNPNERDPAILQQQAQAKLTAMVDQNCRNYATYWWSKLSESSCLLLKARDSAIIVDRLIAVCKEGGDETHPFGASTVKLTSTYQYKSFNDVIIDYIRSTSGTNQDITLCNGTLVDAPGPYARAFIAINKPVMDKPNDCECKNIQGLYQVYQTSYTSKYSTMSAFMQSVYNTTITEGALDTLRRMCNDEFHCVTLTGDNSLAADLVLSTPTSGDYRATHSITMDGAFETTAEFTAEIAIPVSAGHAVVALPPVLQCGNVEGVCVDCENVNSAYVMFIEVYPSVTPTKNDDAASKNTFFAGYLNDKTGLNKTATEYLNFIDQCNSTPGSYAGSLEIGTTCTNEAITVTPTNVTKPSDLSCDNLISTYKNFIAEFPDHVHGATVHMYVDNGEISTLTGSNKLKVNEEMMAEASEGTDTIPVRYKNMTALAALPSTGYWTDVTMNGKQLFEWYMNQHFNANYTYQHYADWLVNGCGYKLNQLPWSDTVAVKADALLSIWNQFAGRYPASQTNITEAVSVPIVKGVATSQLGTDSYSPEWINAMTWTQGGVWYTDRSANTYNLSVLPKNASIQSASLSLYATNLPWTYAAHFRYTTQSPFLQIQQVQGLYIPGISTFSTQPEYYSGVPGVNLAPLSEQVSSGGTDFWSNQNYVNQDVGGLVSAMYSNMLSTGVNYPVQYRLNDETMGSGNYKKFQFGGTGSADPSIRPVLNVSYSASRCDVFTAFVNNALGTYMNLGDVKELFAAKGMVINNECNGFTGSVSCGNSVKVYKSDLLLCGYNTTPTFIPLPEDVLPTACKEGPDMAYAAAQEIYNFRRDSLLGNFDDAYTQKCLSAADIEGLSMQVTTQIGEYQYTLYYYDQSGNLVKTVPPAGVVVNRDAAWLQQVKDKRAAGQTQTPAHTMYTVYRYNSMNQEIGQYSPDRGQVNMWYDRLGRVAVSRNAEQKKTNLYSYTLYDALGRASEVGQKQQPNGMTDATARDVEDLDAWVNFSNTGYPHMQVKRTVYDLAANQVYPDFSQKSYTLRNRVSYTQYFDQLQYGSDNKPTYMNHTQATYYDYDIHGNVSTLLHDYASGAMAANGYNRWKMVAYEYDLASGKVNLVSYQPGKQDEMYQRYTYDAENRVTDVYTTHRKAFVGDRNVEERDASYSFYRHGPLARLVLGNNKVQGLDYAYTLQGWLKGVNSTALNPTFDIGEDGANANSLTAARDAIGFSLNYYTGDYKTIDATKLPFAVTSASLTGYNPLYNGNISNMHVGIKGMETMLYNYGYDQLSRLVSMNAFNNFDNINNQWSSIAAAGKYSERVTYDGNGNIQTYNRDGDKAGAEAMDRLHYNYISGTNKLDHITDDVTDDTRYTSDLDGQAAGNYDYDAIGNLTQDLKENISRIEWTVYGKIRRIEKTNGVNIDYTYDAADYRISKTLSGTGVTGGPITTWYAKDGQGNTLTTYTIQSGAITADEQYVYGSSRLGAKNRNLLLNSSLSIPSGTLPGIGTVYGDELMRGKTQYELSNHLGNVLATISDKKIPHITGSTVDYYEPEIISAQDYYPFGMIQPGRGYNTSGYKYGFNGKENDNEVKGEGNQQDYGMRYYDLRIGRFLSIDPLAKKYPWYSPYQYAGNKPVWKRDVDGLEEEGEEGKYEEYEELEREREREREMREMRESLRTRTSEEREKEEEETEEFFRKPERERTNINQGILSRARVNQYLNNVFDAAKIALSTPESQFVEAFVKFKPAPNYGIAKYDKPLSTNAMRVLSAKLGGVEVAQIYVKQSNGGFYSILYGSPKRITIPQYEGTPYLISHVHPSGNPSPSTADKELLTSIRSIQAANGQPQQTSSTIIPQGAANAKFDLTTPTVDYNPMLLPNVNLKK
jgi:RHS repeat-associated protein